MPSKGISQARFEAFLSLLSPDRDKAAEKYLGLRQRLTQFFYKRGATNAEDLTDEVLDRAVWACEDKQVHDVERYSYGVARHILFESFRATQRENAFLADLASDARNVPKEDLALEREIELETLERAVSLLRKKDRDLLVLYSEMGAAERKDLANKLGISRNALRLRVERIRTAVRDLFWRTPLVALLETFTALPQDRNNVFSEPGPKDSAERVPSVFTERLCSECLQPLELKRAIHRQTRFCLFCASRRKQRLTRESCPPEDRREYMRAYQRAYRAAHPGYNNKYVTRHRQRSRGSRTVPP